ncbi:type II toxin-antitoxin system HicB family antitoxin [Pleurocapsa sp. PCC 7319]|uniref:type II toxin-antitoxin system HicB family antitoxin n=1 Tax=Pleurocapsa sp. PCC 7319 TaxID=118161 RepID=UPI0003451890|nr:type II toxin-antitoxin system HicB family antitoxin [Pleurocapsa sp. PCC 7319]
MKNIYKLPLVLEPQPEGGYTITCPLLPNLITEADTLEEVMPNVSDALSAIIEAYQDLNQPLPSILQPISEQTTLWTESLIPIGA